MDTSAYEQETTGSGGAGAGGSAMTGGSGGSGGSGGVIEPKPEECENGADDDLDGKIDCADVEDCGGVVTCASAPPLGWEGYFSMRSETHTGDPLTVPSCADGSQPVGYFSRPLTQTCVACDCVWPDAKCSAPKMECYDNNTSCTGSSDFSVTATTTGCMDVENLNSCELTGGAVITGATKCEATGGEKVPTPLWLAEIFLCGGPSMGGGCGSGETCVPIDKGEYMYTCIQKAGSDPCPAGFTDEEMVVYTGADDQRDCSPCACLSDASCNNDGGYTIHDDTGCGGSTVKVMSAGCKNVFNQTSNDGAIKATLATVSEGDCGGGEPIGMLVTQGETKICCRH